MSLPRLLQFNYESTVTYNEDGFSTLSVKGVLEIPLTRDPTQATRTFTQTADDLRGEIERRVMRGIDLTRFRMVRRNFSLSRDKRILNWDFTAEEKPYQDLPYWCTLARGSFNVRPAKSGMGLCSWMCTLRATYTVANDTSRRTAWFNFLALLRWRMSYAALGSVPAIIGGQNARTSRTVALIQGAFAIPSAIFNALSAEEKAEKLLDAQKQAVREARKAWLMDFSFDEGLYLDSKTVTFSATWKIVTIFSHILLASGLWARVEGSNKDLWATSMKPTLGAQSWLPNKAATDIIVDFGGGQ